MKGRTIAVAGLAIALAIGAAQLSLSAVMRSGSPDQAGEMWFDPLARLVARNANVISAPKLLAEHETRDIATAVLRTQPLNPMALRLLAAWEDARGKSGRANYLADLSQKVSRRDLLTQLFQIERMVARGDVAGALAHYDLALRTVPDSRQILFPVLTQAMADPTVRNALSPYVRQRAPWMPGFLFGALDSKNGAALVAQLLLDPRSGRWPDLVDGLLSGMLTRLAGQGAIPLAALSIEKLSSAGSTLPEDLSFSARTTDPRYGPFGWQASATPDLDAVFEKSDKGGLQLSISAPTGAIGSQVVLQRIVRITPGSYRFGERRDPAGRATTDWRISCLNGAQSAKILWESRNGRADLNIPVVCPWQQIELNISGEPEGSSSRIVIDGITMTRLIATKS